MISPHSLLSPPPPVNTEHTSAFLVRRYAVCMINSRTVVTFYLSLEEKWPVYVWVRDSITWAHKECTMCKLWVFRLGNLYWRYRFRFLYLNIRFMIAKRCAYCMIEIGCIVFWLCWYRRCSLHFIQPLFISTYLKYNFCLRIIHHKIASMCKLVISRVLITEPFRNRFSYLNPFSYPI